LQQVQIRDRDEADWIDKHQPRYSFGTSQRIPQCQSAAHGLTDQRCAREPESCEQRVNVGAVGIERVRTEPTGLVRESVTSQVDGDGSEATPRQEIERVTIHVRRSAPTVKHHNRLAICRATLDDTQCHARREVDVPRRDVRVSGGKQLRGREGTYHVEEFVDRVSVRYVNSIVRPLNRPIKPSLNVTSAQRSSPLR
jgi:hypothetical protein